MTKAAFKLDLEEKFPHLSHPPIVEAAIHWQSRAQNSLEEDSLREILSHVLPQFPKREAIHHSRLTAMVAGQDAQPKVEHQRGWQGLRLVSEDNLQVVQFKRDGLVFSRIQSYHGWDKFMAEAKPAWRAFEKIAAPVEIQRLSVRFINHIPTATPESLAAILGDPPTCPSNLPLSEFVYQSTFSVPDRPYGIRVIKVMQSASLGVPQSSGLFLDCDVFTTRPLASDERVVDEVLVDLHWLKNKVFFSLLTGSAIESFK